MNRLSAVTIILTLATIAAAFTLLNRNYTRALEQCERIHSRETCIFILR
jgi:hypothetical protein